VAPAYAAYGLLARPGALPAAHAVARYWPVTVVTAQTALSFVLLLTPTGSLPSPRWRWWARMTLAAAIIFLVALAVASGPLDPQYQVLGGPFDFRGQGGVLLVVNQLALTVTTLAVVGAGSLVVRFRRARGVERQQLRWVAWAAALAVLGAVVALGGVAVGATAVVTWAISSCLPSCRWQSGRHSPLSAVRPGPHHQPHPGLRPADAVAGIGLCRGGRGPRPAPGPGFQPGRGRGHPGRGGAVPAGPPPHPAGGRPALHRRRHDTAQTIAAFSDRLHQQIDLDTLTAEVLAVADQTMQPTQVSLWLRPSGNASQDQRTRGASGAAWQPAVPEPFAQLCETGSLGPSSLTNRLLGRWAGAANLPA